MGLAVFDCQMCGRSPYLEIGDDTRKFIHVNGQRYVVCPECAKRFENPSCRKKKTSVTMPKEVLEQIVGERRIEAMKYFNKKWASEIDKCLKG